MIKTLAHICILSADLEKTADFYQRVLGLQRGFDFLKDGALFGFYLKLDDSRFIEVFQRGAGVSPAGGITHFCLEVGDIDVVRARLVECGVAATEKKLGADHSWQIWCKDPDGIDIEFHQYTAESTQLTGRPCHVNW